MNTQDFAVVATQRLGQVGESQPSESLVNFVAALLQREHSATLKSKQMTAQCRQVLDISWYTREWDIGPLADAAAEVDCGHDCHNMITDFDTGMGSCSKTDGLCGWQVAEELRELAQKVENAKELWKGPWWKRVGSFVACEVREALRRKPTSGSIIQRRLTSKLAKLRRRTGAEGSCSN